jgi:effector-binding domain-containing protein
MQFSQNMGLDMSAPSGQAVQLRQIASVRAVCRKGIANSFGFGVSKFFLTLGIGLLAISGFAGASMAKPALIHAQFMAEPFKMAQAPSASPKAPSMTDEAEPKTAPGVSNESGITPVEVPQRPVALLHDGSDWDNGFKTITADFKKIEAEIAKAGLKQAGHPFAIFTETDDNGFKFDAMIPLSEKPEGKTALSLDVQLGSSPAGKAIKFEHRDAYDSIDSTYDLITAYLDEKGLEAKNLFIEEYLTDLKNSDDESLEVDIYVFIK